ncbi:MAG: hypothetical protein IID46_03980 [Planctomycetes bacterium]|nr:hypothetical protein [Planctomycetota bacterium]
MPTFDAPCHTLDAERRKKNVPTQSVGTRKLLIIRLLLVFIKTRFRPALFWKHQERMRGIEMLGRIFAQLLSMGQRQSQFNDSVSPNAAAFCRSVKDLLTSLQSAGLPNKDPPEP